MDGLNWNYDRLKEHLKEAGILAWRSVKSVIAFVILLLLISCELVTTLADAIGLAVGKLICVIFKPTIGEKKAEEGAE